MNLQDGQQSVRQFNLNPASQFAFKEWAVICESLRSGRQSLILRKGGIHEGRDGFRVDHDQFWLFPTEFHQDPIVVSPEAADLFQVVCKQQPPAGEIALHNYAIVEEVVHLRDESQLEPLQQFHIWSKQTVSQRFHYRTPGLFVLLVRIFEQASPNQIPLCSRYAGCRSWVELDARISTESLKPVMTDEHHQDRLNQIRRVLTA